MLKTGARVKIKIKPGEELIFGDSGTRWRILEYDPEKSAVLVIRAEVIGKATWHDKYEDVTWENCALRAWLNGEYLEKFFSEKEREAVISVKTENRGNQKCLSGNGRLAEDKVFLLSIDEVAKYLKKPADRAVGCRWWLRTSGLTESQAAYVDENGCFCYEGMAVYSVFDSVYIRPAFWLNLESEFFQPRIVLDKRGILKYLKPSIICDNNVFIACNDKYLRTLQIPEGITEIGDCAFEGCKVMSSVVIPECVRRIGAEAFKNCYQLKDVSLPNSLESVGEGAFLGCHSLEELIFPPKIRIEGYVIDSCWKLKTLVLPETVDRFYSYGTNHLECLVAPGVKMENVYETGQVAQGNRKKRFAAMVGYIRYTDRFTRNDIIASYNKYLFRRKKDFLPEVWKWDAVQILAVFEENGIITKKNIEEEFIQPAVKNKAVRCTSYLMDWKHRNMAYGGLSMDFEELDKDPYNTSDMKKLWGYKKTEDGTVMITSYLGEESEITVPPRIGKAAVSRIGPYAFSPCMPSAQGYGKLRMPRRVTAMNKLRSVRIPEGVITIDENAFLSASIEKVIIPTTVSSISSEAFPRDKSKVTIFAPAGSYAEEYASANGIRFEIM